MENLYPEYRFKNDNLFLYATSNKCIKYIEETCYPSVIILQ